MPLHNPASPYPEPADAPDLALAKQLHGNLDVAATLGANLFTGPLRTPNSDPTAGGGVIIPAVAVFVLIVGGDPPVVLHDSDEMIAYLHIYIRGEANAFAVGQALARATWRAIQRQPPAGYHETQCLTSEPRFTGEDDQNHYNWVLERFG
jgi:hypothetical protein